MRELGSMPPALLLSRLVDLAQGGPSPTSPVFRDGQTWFRLPWTWWCEELCVSPSTGRRAARVLEARGLVQTAQRARRGGGLHLEWRVDLDRVVRLWVSGMDRAQTVKMTVSSAAISAALSGAQNKRSSR